MRAGFEDVRVDVLAPDWYRGRSPYGVAIAGDATAGRPRPPAPVPAPPEPASRTRRAADARRRRASPRGSCSARPPGPCSSRSAPSLALRARLARRGGMTAGGRRRRPRPRRGRPVALLAPAHGRSARRSACVGLFTIVAAGVSGLDAGAAAFHLFWTLVAGARASTSSSSASTRSPTSRSTASTSRSCRSRRAS